MRRVDGEEAIAAGEDAQAAKSSSMTPGVFLFLAFMLVAGLIFLVWRLQLDPEQSAPSAAVEAEDVVETASIEASEAADAALSTLGGGAVAEAVDEDATVRSARDDWKLQK